eukprot:1002041-Pyramimonas_sp.AAC.1
MMGNAMTWGDISPAIRRCWARRRRREGGSDCSARPKQDHIAEVILYDHGNIMKSGKPSPAI